MGAGSGGSGSGGPGSDGPCSDGPGFDGSPVKVNHVPEYNHFNTTMSEQPVQATN